MADQSHCRLSYAAYYSAHRHTKSWVHTSASRQYPALLPLEEHSPLLPPLLCDQIPLALHRYFCYKILVLARIVAALKQAKEEKQPTKVILTRLHL
jgi:hypothetical protein